MACCHNFNILLFTQVNQSDCCSDSSISISLLSFLHLMFRMFFLAESYLDKNRQLKIDHLTWSTYYATLVMWEMYFWVKDSIFIKTQYHARQERVRLSMRFVNVFLKFWCPQGVGNLVVICSPVISLAMRHDHKLTYVWYVVLFIYFL